MTALEEAKRVADKITVRIDALGIDTQVSLFVAVEVSHMYAAIAQAEAVTRIADILEHVALEDYPGEVNSTRYLRVFLT